MGCEPARCEKQERLCGGQVGVACCYFFADLRGGAVRINDCGIFGNGQLE